jgi:hypothetical protein
VWEILVQVIFLASLALDWWSSPFSQGIFLLEISLSILILMISIRLIPIEGRFESFPPLIGLHIFLVLPRFLQILSYLALLIHVFSLPDGFIQGIGLIILDLFLIKGWHPLRNLYILTFSSPMNLTYFNNPKKFFSYSIIVILPNLSSKNSCIFLSYKCSERYSFSKYFLNYFQVILLSLMISTCFSWSHHISTFPCKW